MIASTIKTLCWGYCTDLVDITHLLNFAYVSLLGLYLRVLFLLIHSKSYKNKKALQQVIGLTAFILVTVADFSLSTFPSIYAIDTALSRIKHHSP